MNSGNISKEETTNQNKSKVSLKNIKSDYILRKLFDIIKKNKSLAILKCNKTLQRRLNININDYKEYCQLYSSIEVELKLDENKDNKNHRFINIPDKSKEYYHIYFDNSNEGIKRNYLKGKEKVNIIRIIINHQVKSFKKLFCDCECIRAISLINFIGLM